jgi:hypothetical protein
MQPLNSLFRCTLVPLIVAFVLFGCADDSASEDPANDATLTSLTVIGADLDQTFQPTQASYTGSVTFLTTSITIVPEATNSAATIRVGGQIVSSGETSVAVPLAEGDNLVAVSVTAEDNKTTQVYDVNIYRATTEEFAQQSYLKASNAEAGDIFGYSVAISGDTLVVGANQEDSAAAGSEADNTASGAGAVYVFARTGSSWSQQAYLKASNIGVSDIFGSSVAIDGDTLVVGAYGEDSSAAGGEVDNSATDAGAVYVFTRTGSNWSKQAYLKASNAETNDFFGSSVAIDGNTLVVGADREDSSVAGDEADNNATQAGAAYVFTRTGGTWSQQAYLKASNADDFDLFGYSVAIDGDTLVVGAYGESSTAAGGETDNSALDTGAVYVFTRNGSSWSQQAYLKASNADAADYFGFSVAIDGGTLVVGAYLEDSSAAGGEANNTASNAGAAYVFTRTGTTWSQQAYLKASNAEENDDFGYSVAVSGDTLVVGASEEDSSAAGSEANNTASNAGAAYVFTRTGTTWSQQAYLKTSNADASDIFGRSVAIDGDTVVVSATNEDSSAAGGEADNTASSAGAVYVWQ